MKSDPPERLPQKRLHMAIFQWLLPLAVLALIALPMRALADTETGNSTLPIAIPTYGWQTALVILLMIALNGLFIAAESAIELLRPAHVRILDGKSALVVQELIDNKARYIAACSLGSQTLMAWMMAASFIPSPALANLFATSQGIQKTWVLVLAMGLLVTIPVAIVNLVFGILIPKSYAALHPIRVGLRTYGVVKWFSILFSPAINVLSLLANLIANRFGAQASFLLPRQAEEEIRSLVDTAQETGEIELDEKQLLHSVFEFGDTIAREVMTPRVDLDAASIETPPEEILEMIRTSGHSRIPIYEDTDDVIIGIVHVKDLLVQRDLGKPFNLRTIIRPALFVPENKNLHELMREMRQCRAQMAIVQDEYGGTAGVVTIEDIVEELVGDIVDEYDVEENLVTPKEHGWVVEARINLYDLNSEIGSNFSSEEFDTLGGYLFGLFGRQPKVGETLESDGYRFVVEKTDGRRINQARVEPIEPQQELFAQSIAE